MPFWILYWFDLWYLIFDMMQFLLDLYWSDIESLHDSVRLLPLVNVILIVLIAVFNTLSNTHHSWSDCTPVSKRNCLEAAVSHYLSTQYHQYIATCINKKSHIPATCGVFAPLLSSSKTLLRVSPRKATWGITLVTMAENSEGLK